MLNLGLTVGWLLTFLTFIIGCAPSPEGEEGFDWSLIIFLLLMFAIFYLLLIRPQRKRQKEHEELIQELRKGDQVITAGGIYGVIESLSDESVVLRVESGATIRVTRKSIISRQQK
jgi:preprotein translocase subunit YajC